MSGFMGQTEGFHSKDDYLGQWRVWGMRNKSRRVDITKRATAVVQEEGMVDVVR